MVFHKRLRESKLNKLKKRLKVFSKNRGHRTHEGRLILRCKSMMYKWGK